MKILGFGGIILAAFTFQFGRQWITDPASDGELILTGSLAVATSLALLVSSITVLVAPPDKGEE